MGDVRAVAVTRRRAAALACLDTMVSVAVSRGL